MSFDGKEISLSEMRGKCVILDFWATWCSPCREAIPHLIHLYNTYKGEGLVVIGISVDKGDEEKVRRFVKSLEIPYPVIVAPDDLEARYRVRSLPTTFLIDRRGKIRGRFVGFNAKMAKEIARRIKELLSEQAAG